MSNASDLFPRMAELEDALQAREGIESTMAHSLMVQILAMIGLIHARLRSKALSGAILDEFLTEIADRLTLLIKVSPETFDPKQISAMLTAFQADFKDLKGN